MSDVIHEGALTLRLEGRFEGIKAQLEEIGYPVKDIEKRLLGVVARAAKAQVKANMGAFLQMGHSGRVLKSGKLGKGGSLSLRQRVYGYSRSETHWVVAAPRYIAEPLERGVTVKPKGGKFLSFMGRDGFRRVGQFTIRARHWFTRSIAGFEESPAVDRAIDNAEQKWTEAWLERRAVVAVDET